MRLDHKLLMDLDQQVPTTSNTVNADEALTAQLQQFDLSLVKKKKKKKKTAETVEEPSSGGKADSNALPWSDSDRDYTYTEMLDRVFRILREKNPNLSQRKAHRLPPPDLDRIGTKKTMWSNFAQIASLIHRQQDHVMAYFMTEMATEGSLDSSQRLVMRGRFQPKQIESLLRKYIIEYVTCNMCRSPDTRLTRDPMTRLYFVACSNCGSSRSVAPIRSGFHATSRADRRAARA